MPDIEITTYHCPRCDKSKPRGEFGRNRTIRRGFGSYCKQCCSEWQRDRRDKDPNGPKQSTPYAIRKALQTEQRCARCGERKPFTDFSPNGRGGYDSRCKCCNARRRRERRRHQKLLDPEGVRRRDRENIMKSVYGLTKAALTAMWERQAGRCACCQDPLCPENKGVHVDHDHKSGAVRSFLCRPCNIALAMVRESTERAQCLISYIDTYC